MHSCVFIHSRRLMQMAHQVCDDDPRTIPQRRADASGALVAGPSGLPAAAATPTSPIQQPTSRS